MTGRWFGWGQKAARTSGPDRVSLVPVVVGALNWGLVGIGQLVMADRNLLDPIFGPFPAVESLIYGLVGLTGVTELNFADELYGARNMPPAREREAAQ